MRAHGILRSEPFSGCPRRLHCTVRVQNRMKSVVDRTAHQTDSNRENLEQLYRDHGEALRCFLYGRVYSDADIDDIVQDVFMRLARRDDLEERTQEGFKKNRAYIFTMANNLVVDMERGRQVRQKYQAAKYQQAEGRVDELAPEIVAVAQEHMGLVKEAIKALKPEWRTALILSRFKHMSHKEIASVMDITHRQAEGFISKAVLALHDMVKQMYQRGSAEREQHHE